MAQTRVPAIQVAQDECRFLEEEDYSQCEERWKAYCEAELSRMAGPDCVGVRCAG